MRCTNCGRNASGGQYVGSNLGPRCMFCRGPLVAQQPQQQYVGYDPTVMDGYENVTAVYQDTSLVTGPGDVQTEKDFLMPYFQQMDTAVRACAQQIPAASRSYWAGLAANWRKFYGTKSTVFSASEDLTTTKRFQAQLTAFQAQIAPYCPDASTITVPTPDQGAIANATQTAKDLIAKADKAAADFNTTARVALVVGGVLVGWFIYRQYKMAENIGPKVLPYLPKILAV